MRNAAASKALGILQATDPVTSYLQEIRDSQKLSSKEERALAVRIRNGDRKAVKELANANLKFVVAITREYENRGLRILDLISEGNLGLIDAAARFDGSHGCRFTTFAGRHIRHALQSALANPSRSMRSPRPPDRSRADDEAALQASRPKHPGSGMEALEDRSGSSKERASRIRDLALRMLSAFLRWTADYPCFSLDGRGPWALP
jgi:RNA polymerase primary sigma factor